MGYPISIAVHVNEKFLHYKHGVFNDPIRLRAGFVVADQQNSMVDFAFYAIRIIENPMLVEQELFIYMDCNRDGVAHLDKGFLQIFLIWCNRFVSSDPCNNLTTRDATFC